MDGSVDLKEFTKALPPRPRRMPGLPLLRLMAFRGLQPGGSKDPMELPIADRDPFVFIQLLQKVPEVEARVFALVKREYPPFRLGVRLPFRRLPAVAVPEGGGAPFGVGPLQLVRVLLGDA